MRKVFAAMVLVIVAAALGACESGGAPTALGADDGKPLGDTGVRVSGSLDVGGSAVAH